MQKLQLAKKEFDITEHFLYEFDKTTKVLLNCFFYSSNTLYVVVTFFYYDLEVLYYNLDLKQSEYDDIDLQYDNIDEAMEDLEDRIIMIITDIKLGEYNDKINKINNLFKDTLRGKCMFNIIFNELRLNTYEHIKEEKNDIIFNIREIIDKPFKQCKYMLLLNKEEKFIYFKDCDLLDFLEYPQEEEDIYIMSQYPELKKVITRDIF